MPKNIEAATLEDLFSKDLQGYLPILVDIEDDGIIWETKDAYDEDGHLRLVSGNVPIMYEGKKFRPAVFTFEQPQEDGTKVGNTSITISAIDKRVVEIIEQIENPPIVNVVAAYAKINEEEVAFSKIYHYRFQMGSVQWDGVTAKWNLMFDSAMNQNMPVDLATESRCPAAYEDN